MGLYDYFEAIDWYSQSLKIYCEIDNQLGICHTYKMLKWIYYYLGKYENALDYLNKQMDVANQFDLRDQEIAGLAVASRYYSSLGDFNRAESFSKRWEVLWNEIEDQLRGAWSIIHISRFNLHKGNHQAVKDYCRQCVDIFIGRNQPDGEIDRLLLLGDAISGLGEQEEAEEVYQQAIILGYEIHQPRQVLEAQAGLARVSMARGETEQALIQVEDILAYIEANTPPKGSSFCLDGTEEPFRILLTCYHALKANTDGRAHSILTDAYNLLQKRAANISDEHLRDCFLNNVAINREIVDEYEALGLEGCAPL